MCLEFSALEFRKRGFLAVTSSVLVLEPDVARTPQLRGPFDFLATHFVNRLVDELNDVKLIEGDRRLGPMLTYASPIACRHIHTDRADVLGTGARSLERIGKLGHDRGFSPFAGIEPTRSIEIVKQAHIIVATPNCVHAARRSRRN